MRISFLDTTGLSTITMRLSRFVIMLILIYGHLFVSLAIYHRTNGYFSMSSGICKNHQFDGGN